MCTEIPLQRLAIPRALERIVELSAVPLSLASQAARSIGTRADRLSDSALREIHPTLRDLIVLEMANMVKESDRIDWSTLEYMYPHTIDRKESSAVVRIPDDVSIVRILNSFDPGTIDALEGEGSSFASLLTKSVASIVCVDRFRTIRIDNWIAPRFAGISFPNLLELDISWVPSVDATFGPQNACIACPMLERYVLRFYRYQTPDSIEPLIFSRSLREIELVNSSPVQTVHCGFRSILDGEMANFLQGRERLPNLKLLRLTDVPVHVQVWIMSLVTSNIDHIFVERSSRPVPVPEFLARVDQFGSSAHKAEAANVVRSFLLDIEKVPNALPVAGSQLPIRIADAFDTTKEKDRDVTITIITHMHTLNIIRNQRCHHRNCRLRPLSDKEDADDRPARITFHISDYLDDCERRSRMNSFARDLIEAIPNIVHVGLSSLLGVDPEFVPRSETIESLAISETKDYVPTVLRFLRNCPKLREIFHFENRDNFLCVADQLYALLKDRPVSCRIGGLTYIKEEFFVSDAEGTSGSLRLPHFLRL